MREVAAVCVPESVCHGHDANAGFDESPGDQELIVPQRPADAALRREAD